MRQSRAMARPASAVPAVDRAALIADWPVLLVLVGYLGTAFVVPTLANVAVTDDWVYYRSVETLLVQHKLQVPSMSSAALVFQTAWGALFASVLGLDFGALRISTVTIVGISGGALYALARELGISRGLAALATAAYLFNPLSLALAYTFMTDPHFTALVVIATWLYVRGLRHPATAGGWLVAGSVAAACALLVRQQGVLIPAGVVAGLLVVGRLRWDRPTIRVLLQTCAVPVVVTLAFGAWLRFSNGMPWAMSLFLHEVMAAGVGGVAGLLPRLVVIEGVYLGLFVLPIAVALLPMLMTLWWGATGWGRAAAAIWAAVVVAGTLVFWSRGLSMPYAGQFITTSGLGPEDLLAARPALLDTTGRLVLTVVCALAAIVLGLGLSHASSAGRSARSAVAPLVGVAIGQLLGTIPPSVHFIGWGGTLDRYLLPLLPLSLVLLLWAVRGVQLLQPAGWATAALIGVVAVAGTHDHLTFLDTAWSLAEDANQDGVADTHLDAGAGWDGLHLFVAPPSPDAPLDWATRPWWVNLFAPATDSTYLVAGVAFDGYTIIEQRDYPSWLQRRALTLYLLRGPGVAGPP